MKNPRIVLWPLAFFPWIDYLVRTVCDFHGFHFLPGPVWDELFLVFCMVLVLFGSRTGPGMPDRSGPVRWCFLTFVLACALSLSVNGVPFRMGVEALRVTFQPMLYALITMVLLRDEGLRDEFIKLIILSGVLIALAGLGQYALGIESRRWVNKPNMEQFRIVSIFANPNALAGYLNMVLAFSLARAWYGHGGRGMIFSAASPCSCRVPSGDLFQGRVARMFHHDPVLRDNNEKRAYSGNCLFSTHCVIGSFCRCGDSCGRTFRIGLL